MRSVSARISREGGPRLFACADCVGRLGAEGSDADWDVDTAAEDEVDAITPGRGSSVRTTSCGSVGSTSSDQDSALGHDREVSPRIHSGSRVVRKQGLLSLEADGSTDSMSLETIGETDASETATAATADSAAAAAAAAAANTALLNDAAHLPEGGRIVGEACYVPSTKDSSKEELFAATPDKLVELLAVSGAMPDWDFIAAFLITFRYFMEPAELLRRLRERYAYRIDETLPAEARAEAEKWRGPVQLRVINIVQRWVGDHFYDFQERTALAPAEDVGSVPLASSNRLRRTQSGASGTLLDQLLEFIEIDVARNNAKWTRQLTAAIQTRAAEARFAGSQSALDSDAEPEAVAFAMKQPESYLVRPEVKLGRRVYRAVILGDDMIHWCRTELADKPDADKAQMVVMRLAEARLLVLVEGDGETYAEAEPETATTLAAAAASLGLDEESAASTSNESSVSLGRITLRRKKPKKSSFFNPEKLYRFTPQPNDPEEMWFPTPLWSPSTDTDPSGLQLTLFDVDIEELARQITLMDAEAFQRISPLEIKSQAWSGKDAAVRSPFLSRLIQNFNRLSFWCAGRIVTITQDKEKRVKALRRIISLGEVLLQLHNYSSMFAVVIALNMASVGRLKRTWAALPDSVRERFKRLADLASFDDNHRRYRAAIGSATPPAIPYMGLYLHDLTHIEDGNNDRLPNGMINFSKMEMIARVWQQISLFQSQRSGYKFKPISTLQGFVAEMPELTEDELYKHSLEAEPRGVAAIKADRRSRSHSITQGLAKLVGNTGDEADLRAITKKGKLMKRKSDKDIKIPVIDEASKSPRRKSSLGE